MWEINDGAVPRAIVFSLSPCRAQLQLGRREQPTADDLMQEDLLLRPVAEALRQAEAGDPEHRRAGRLREQRDAAVHARATATARVDELSARRRRLTLEAAPGLAEALLDLDREAAAAQADRDKWADRVSVLQQEVDRLTRELERVRQRAIRTACAEVGRDLAARRAALVAEVAARVSPLLEELLSLEMAVVELSRPDALAERVANMASAPCPSMPPTPEAQAPAQAKAPEHSPTPPAPPSPEPEPDPADPVTQALAQGRRRGRKTREALSAGAAPLPE